MPPFGYAEIRALLPHRYPMLMVDAVIALVPHVSIVAVKCVTRNEPCYARLPDDATPRQTAYPVSLILESFSQSGVILWMQGTSSQRSDGVLMFGVARDCVFERDVYPGDTMEHRVILNRVVADSLFFSGETWVGDKRVARLGWLVAVIRAREDLAPHASETGGHSPRNDTVSVQPLY